VPADSPANIFDRALLRRRRERAAARAAAHDFLLERAADDLAERLMIVRRRFDIGANIGAHHGLLTRKLLATGRVGHMIDVDSTAGVLAAAPGERIVADEEALPFAEASLDLAVSALSLQLVNDLPGVLVQIRRALKPDGLLLAALLGGATLRELREAWVAAESEISGGVSPRVAPFADVRDMGMLLQRAGFALPVVDSDTVTVTYADPISLMREIKAMGASNVLAARRQTPATRGLLLRAAQIYAERFAQPDGRIPATFEVLTLTAWAPDPSQPQPLRPGSATTRLADALGVPERKLKE
jgi:SAM-dependent methyltransferase